MLTTSIKIFTGYETTFIRMKYKFIFQSNTTPSFHLFFVQTKKKQKYFQVFLILGPSKRFWEHLKTTKETDELRKRSQDYWGMRRWSCIAQCPTRKAFACVSNINILGYCNKWWGPEGGGLSSTAPLFHSLDLFFLCQRFFQLKLFYF